MCNGEMKSQYIIDTHLIEFPAFGFIRHIIYTIHKLFI